jgi:hypothetical protein
LLAPFPHENRSRLLIALALVTCLLIGIPVVRQYLRMQGLARLQAVCRTGPVRVTFRDPRFVPTAMWQDCCHYSAKWWGSDYTQHPRYILIRWMTFGSVEHISMRASQLDPGAGEAIAKIDTLRALSLIVSSRVSESEVAAFCVGVRQLPYLEHLNLYGLRFTDAGLAPLAGHPRLRMMSLTNTWITGRSTAMLASLPRLTYLSIHPPKVGGFTVDDHKELIAALPNVRVSLAKR